MLNFYRRFLPQAAATQEPLQDVLSGPSVKCSHPIGWTPELHKPFEECKAILSRSTLLAHPEPSAQLALVIDSSTSAMGALLQQRADNACEPLALFSKKLNPAQQKYSAYDRELLGVYEVVKQFRHVLAARHFIIFTDHKPITYAFQQKRHKCSPRQFNHLDFIAQFNTDIRRISGQDKLSPTLFLALNPSPRQHLTTHWPHRRTVTTNLELFWRRAPPSGSRGNRFPEQRSPSTAIHLPGSLGRTFLLPYGSKCSSPSTICHTLGLKLQRS
jgi:hypothetical protein